MDMAGANGPDWGARGSRRYIVQAVEASLRRLGTDWIDLYQFHTPDPLTPIEETLAALDDLVQGKVRYIGHSNLAGWQIAEAEFTARAARRHPLHLRPEPLQPAGPARRAGGTARREAYGLGVLPYFPLANGLLTGKYSAGHGARGQPAHPQPPEPADGADWEQLRVRRVRRGTRPHRSGGRVLLAAAQPSVTSVIAGATTAGAGRRTPPPWPGSRRRRTSPSLTRSSRARRRWPCSHECRGGNARRRHATGRARCRDVPDAQESASGSTAAPVRLLLDVDTGIDDAFALVYLLSRPEVAIEAITCTAGNVGARQVALNNLAVLELCGRTGVEVAIGAEVPLQIPLVTTEETHEPQGIGHAVLPEPAQAVSARHAVDVWVDQVRAHPGEITGLITGPLTNFALALRREADLPRLLKGLVIMGGCFYYQEHHPNGGVERLGGSTCRQGGVPGLPGAAGGAAAGRVRTGDHGADRNASRPRGPAGGTRRRPAGTGPALTSRRACAAPPTTR